MLFVVQRYVFLFSCCAIGNIFYRNSGTAVSDKARNSGLFEFVMRNKFVSF